jgi:hypothetical protein
MKWLKRSESAMTTEGTLEVDGMKRERVTSSNIKSIGYDAAKKILEVEFKSGAIYHYKDVPADVHKSFMRADSKGKFLFNEIKGTYDFKKISG